METPEKILIFSQKKAFLKFREMEIPKKCFIFQETSYISGITSHARKSKFFILFLIKKQNCLN